MSRFDVPAQGPNSGEPMLCPDDQRLLDALVEAGFDPSAIERPTETDRRRAETMCNLLGLMKDYPVDECDPALLDATLARIDRAEDDRTARMNFDARQTEIAGEARSGRRIRLPDFITVAAVILIAVGVLWPTLSNVRQKSMDLACANNMRYVGYALQNYAADNHGAVPMAQAGLGGTWDKVANFLNLRPLVDGGYCEVNHLECPGHDHDQIGPSYSYRWQMPDAPVHWNAGRVTVILGDRNPLIDAARSGRVIPALSMSLNHGGRGQNVLASDGGVMWLDQPLIDRTDNIWLPDGDEELHIGDLPHEAADVFLAH